MPQQKLKEKEYFSFLDCINK